MLQDVSFALLSAFVVDTEDLYAQGHPGSSSEGWAHRQSNGVHWTEFRLIIALNCITVSFPSFTFRNLLLNHVLALIFHSNVSITSVNFQLW